MANFPKRKSFAQELRNDQDEEDEQLAVLESMDGEDGGDFLTEDMEKAASPSAPAKSSATADDLITVKRQKTANMWEHFTHNTAKGKYKCRYCFKEYAAPKGNSIGSGNSTLTSHIKKQHSYKHKSAPKQLVPACFFKKDVAAVALHVKQTLDKEIRQWLDDAEMPFSFVDRESFRRMMKTACPGYKVVTRNTQNSAILNDLDQYKKRVVTIFGKNELLFELLLVDWLIVLLCYSILCFINSVTDWLMDWFVSLIDNSSIDWLIEWLID